MFYLLFGEKTWEILFLRRIKQRIPYGFDLTPTGSLEIKENKAETVRMIFGYYLAGASFWGATTNRSGTMFITSPWSFTRHIICVRAAP